MAKNTFPDDATVRATMNRHGESGPFLFSSVELLCLAGAGRT